MDSIVAGGAGAGAAAAAAGGAAGMALERGQIVPCATLEKDCATFLGTKPRSPEELGWSPESVDLAVRSYR